MNAKIELLSRVPLFQGLSKRQLAQVASLADEIDLPSDRELTHEGATGTEFVVIIDGVADVTRNGELINKLGPGDFLGEISVVTPDGNIPTGLTKFGAIVGDRTEIGCNAVINPGSALGRDCMIYPGVNFRGVLPHGSMVKLRQDLSVFDRRE